MVRAKAVTWKPRKIMPERAAEKAARRFAAVRRMSLASLALARKHPASVRFDSNVRRVSIKAARLPFACIEESCGGHFWLAPYHRREISLLRIPAGRHVYYTGPYFDLAFGNSPEAARFKEALFEVFGKKPANRVVLRPGPSVRQKSKKWADVEISPGREREVDKIVISFGPSISPLDKMVNKPKAAEMARKNNEFIAEFERIVDVFLAEQRKKA